MKDNLIYMSLVLWTSEHAKEVHHLISNDWTSLIPNVRVWVSNVLRLSDKKRRPILILNRGGYKDWEMKASMVGGTAHILDNHQIELTNLWAKRFGDRHWWYPESFDVSSKKIRRIIERLRREVSGIIEDNPDREIEEELTQECFKWRRNTPILKRSDTEWLVSVFSWLAIPIFSWWNNSRLKIVRVFDGKGLSDTAIKKMSAADSVVFIPNSLELAGWFMIRNGETIQISKLARWIYLKEMYGNVPVLH